MASRKHFTPYEKRVVIECVDKKKSIIENMRTNGQFRGEKNVCWEEIFKEYHATPNVRPFTLTQLQNLYRNEKRKATKLANEERQSLYKTGGGQPSIPSEGKLDPLSERLLHMGVVRNPLPPMKDGDVPTGTVMLDFEEEDEEEIDVLVSEIYNEEEDTSFTSLPPAESTPFSPEPSEGHLSSQPPVNRSSQPPGKTSTQPTLNTSRQSATSGASLKNKTKSTRSTMIEAYHEKAKRRAPASAKAADAIEQLSLTKRKIMEEEIKFSEEYYTSLNKKVKTEISLNQKLEEKIQSEIEINKLTAIKLKLEIAKLQADAEPSL